MKTDDGRSDIVDGAGTDASRWIKTAACSIFFIAAAAYFAKVGAELLEDYFIVFAPTMKETVPWLIRLGIASLLLLLMFGVIAALIRPTLVAAATIAAGIAAYVLVLGGGDAIFFSAGVVCIFLISANFSLVRQLENQVDFSTRPIGDKELLLCSLLAVLLAVPAGLGYVRDSASRHYVIPPQLTRMAMERSDDYVRAMVDAQRLPEPQRTLIMRASQEQIVSWIGDAEKKAEPFQRYVPFVLGVAAYFTFQMLLFIPGFVVPFLLDIVFWALKLTRFARVSRHTRVVNRLTLKRKPPEKDPAVAAAV